MKNLIANVVSQVPSPLSNVVTTRELILPKPIINRRSLLMNRFSKRQRNPVSNHNTSGGIKQQAHFTPIIELKPILGNSTLTNEGDNNEPMKKVTKIISTNTIPKDSQHVKTIVCSKRSHLFWIEKVEKQKYVNIKRNCDHENLFFF